MSSHREAPEISKDPVADNTDTYAFVSPDKPDTVTLITNYVPLEGPAGGPNFYSFGDDVLYAIHIDNDGDGKPDVTYSFRFHTTVADEDTFLYNTGPITSISDSTFNVKQFYQVTRVEGTYAQRENWWDYGTRLGSNLACPPCNVGPLSTPNYATLASQAVHSLAGGRTVFAGQRAEGFYVDLGAIFDLGQVRDIDKLHTTFGLKGVTLTNMPGVNATAALNVNSIAIQVPIRDVTRGGWWHSGGWDNKHATIGVWGAAYRQRVRIYDADKGEIVNSGPYRQVSRLGNPLFNEVINPLGQKDQWNSLPPSADKLFAKNVANPELAALLPVLYPGVFPNLAAYNKTGKARADLEAILLTGIPAGIIKGFQNYTGATQADELRLNTAIPPTTKNPSTLGLLGNDPAGFPNGRRVFDDVTSIELKALAGATLPLVDKSYKADAAVADVTGGVTDTGLVYLEAFPYLGTPHDGFYTPDATPPQTPIG